MYGSAPGAFVRCVSMIARRISEMYTAAGLSCRISFAHSGSVAGSVAMLYMTPQKYRHTRVRNGTSWLTSFSSAPIRAMIRPAPMLNSVCSSSTGMARNQYQVSGSWESSTMMTMTTMDSISCCSSTMT